MRNPPRAPRAPRPQSVSSALVFSCLVGMLGVVGGVAEGRAWAAAARQPESVEGEPGAQPVGEGDGERDGEGGGSDALMTEEALARFERLLERRPFHDSAFNEMVKSFAERGAIAELVQAYEDRVAALPEAMAPRVILARLQLRAGDVERAAEVAETIELPEDSRDAGALLILRATISERLGKMDEALALLSKALEQEATIAGKLDLAEALADLHLRAGSKEEAAAVLTGLAATFPGEYLHRKRIAEALAQRDLHEAAAGEYRALLELVGANAERRCEVLRLLGRSQERLGQADEAIASYTEAIRLLADDHWLQRELQDRIVALHRASGKLEELVAYCRAEIERSPTQVSMRSLLAEVLAARGDMEGAIGVLSEAVELFPADRSLSERRIALLERADQPEAAFAEHERIIAEHPDDLELYIAYGQALVRHERVDAARNQWRHVLNNELVDAGTALRLAQILESHQMMEDAAECYERAIALAPNRADAYVSLSRLKRAEGDEPAALAVLERMSAANASDAGMQADLAAALLAFGKVDEALAAIERACALAPENVRFLAARADLLVRAGRLEDALRLRRETVELIRNPVEQAQAIGEVVSAHASAGKLEELIAAETAALDAGEEDPVRLLVLARAADFQRDFAAARRWLERLLALDASHEEGRRQLARLQEALGDVDAAIKSYELLIEQHPARARQYYQAIVDSMLAYGDQAGAVRTLARLRREAGGNVTVLSSVAEQLVRLEEMDDALTCYEEALRVQPERHETRLAYAKALQEAGRLEEALEEFRAASMQTVDRETAAEALGRLHDVAGDLGVVDDLLDELELRVQQNPEESTVAATVSRLLIQEYEYTRAMGVIEAGLRARPREAELLLVRAELLRRLARFDEALETYREVLPLPNVDRDLVLGEMGKACFEAGRVEEARRQWLQISHKMYAGTLLRNNGLLEEAVDVLREGIRLKPDDQGLRRNLVEALESAGREDEALQAAQRLLDLEPGNSANIKRLARAYIQRGDRATAAEIAGRLFSADVAAPAMSAGGQQQSTSWSGMSSLAAVMYAGMYGQSGPTNLSDAIEFFRTNGLMGELEGIIEAQLASQPDNALLRVAAVGLYQEAFAKPERALALLTDLETMEFPLEYQAWLGTCSQRDYFRIIRYGLIGSKPALRDARLTALNGRDDLGRDEALELAMIRQSQGNIEESITLLSGVVATNDDDSMALSALTDALVRAERFTEAEVHARRLIEVRKGEHERLQGEMAERVRRDFVRTLPVQLQLRMTDDLIREVAYKWTLGQGMARSIDGSAQVMGYLRAKLTLATILAETDRMEEARAIWQEVTPRHPADSEGWTTLGDVVQLYGQEDLAFECYWNALEASRLLAADPLLRRIFGDESAWYRAQNAPIDASFNRIVGAFAKRDRLVELYDFLRDTGQTGRAGWIAEQYELRDDLKGYYGQRVEQAAASFAAANEPMTASPAYFAEVCKLAELYDAEGDWASAKAAYTAYLESFPDELGLVLTLGDVAEALGELEEAVDWEERAIECKRRLSRNMRAWSLRELHVTPRVPSALESRIDAWSWPMRWSNQGGRRGGWWGADGRASLEQAPSWMRIARLRLAQGNTIAAGEAMERALGTGGSAQGSVADDVLTEIRQRRLIGPMLPVLRAMAVQSPDDEDVQLAFGESLEANQRPEVATEVYRRLLRRGVTDLSVLAQVQQRLAALSPQGEGFASDTLESLQESVRANPGDMAERLRLAKALYYSLRVDEALAELAQVRDAAPHLEGVEGLWIEMLTLKGDDEALIAALREQVRRATADHERSRARDRLARVLLGAGRIDEALEELKQSADPAQPESYQRIGMLLQYFGRHEEAIEQFTLAGKSQQHAYNTGRTGSMLASALVAKGDVEKAADEIMRAVQEQARQATQYGGLYAMYGGGEADPFAPFLTLFILQPELEERVRAKLLALRDENGADAGITRLLMRFYRLVGENESADALLAETVERSAADEQSIMLSIERAVSRGDVAGAIRLAEDFIAQQPKPEVPPGMPAEYAGMMVLMSPRNAMVCKLGDLYWKQGEQEKAFETYRRLVDDKIDVTQLAYATICLLRGRVEEAGQIVDAALGKQAVKSPSLLQFAAVIAALEGQPQAAFERLTTIAAMTQGGDEFQSQAGGAFNQALQVARAAGMLDSLVAFLRGRIEKSPTDWDLRRNLATVLKDAGRVAEAMEVLDQAAERPAMRLSALELKLEWERASADPEMLIPLYEELITLSETSNADTGSRSRWGASSDPAARYRSTLGDLLWQVGRTDEAVARWTERLDMSDASGQLELAQKFMAREAYGQATACIARALELDPKNVAAHRLMAGLCRQSGDMPGLLEHARFVFKRQYLRGDSEGGSSPDGSEEQSWAQALSSSETTAVEIAALPPAEQASVRLMLATWLGDWSAVEAALLELRDASPYDPRVWTLLARCYERRGAWEEAAAALRQVRRMSQTTLPNHEQQLDLVLAGKQVREAAAGTRQSAGAGAGIAGSSGWGQFAGSGYYRGYYGYGGSADSTTRRLALIHTRLGDFQQAERLYLSGRMEADALGPLAHLMWGQGARERALELLRLSALMFPGNSYSIVQYADMLAEGGDVDQAVALLERAYAYHEPVRDEAQYGWYARWYYSSDDSAGVDSGEQATLAEALHSLLKRYGRLEERLGALSRRLGDDPENVPMRRLLLSLYMRGERWQDVQASLSQWLALNPDNPSALALAFQASVQIGDWAAATRAAEQLHQADPERQTDWVLRQAFLALAAGDEKAAAATVSGALAGESTPSSADLVRLGVALACAGEDAQLVPMLTARGQERSRDETLLLLAALEAAGRWQDAAELSADQFFREADVLTKGWFWFERLRSAVRAADAAGEELSLPHPGSQVLAKLTLEGAGAAGALAESLLGQHPDDVDLRRAAVFAAYRGGKWKAAAAANQSLLEWLAPRRLELWRPAEPMPIARRAKLYLDQARRRGGDTQTVLQMSMQYESIMQQLLALGGEVEPRPYQQLHEAHRGFQGRLLRLAGDAAAYEAFAQADARRELLGLGTPRWDSYDYYQSYDQLAQQEEEDWRTSLRSMLLERGQFAALIAHGEAMGARLPADAWDSLAAAHAALGHEQEAAAWRRRAGELKLAELAAGDLPSLDGGGRSWSWWWYRRDSGSEGSVQEELRNVRLESVPDGPVESLADLAALDPELEERLLETVESAGPGWGQTRLVAQVVAFLQREGKPGQVIELLETVHEGELFRSSNLAEYLAACAATGDAERFERTLKAVERFSPRLQVEADLLRMALARLAGETEAADEIEARCRAVCKRNRPNPARPAARFCSVIESLAANQGWASEGGGGTRFRGHDTELWPLAEGAETVADLASLLGLEYTPEVGEDDLTIERLADVYERFGLYADAVRILDSGLADEGLAPRAREDLLIRKAHALSKVGRFEEARAALSPVIARLESDSREAQRLIELYSDEELGADPARALEILRQARQRDPLIDVGGALEAELLFRAGRFAEAWTQYCRCLEAGAIRYTDSEAVLCAGIAGAKAGDERAQPLLRLGLWRSPFHDLAASAKELVQ